MTELLVLGPVEIRASGRPVGRLQPRQHHVLAALLVDANRPVTWSTLVDRVWGVDAPDGARTAMRAHVSRIRMALHLAAELSGRPVRLIRGGGGYQVQADLDQIDLHRLRRLADRARTTTGDERVRLLREAVGLWRGEPLAGLPGEWASRVRSAWQHEHLDVVAAWALAELELGNAATVTAALADLTEEHPLVESVAAAYVRALHAAGRTAEAIDRYMRVTNRLADELGVGPGTELRKAYQSILREERPPPVAPFRPAVSAGPRQLPLDVRGFVGRHDQLARLDALLADPGPLVLLRGTAGVGKTTLAVHWAHRLADRFPEGQLYLNLRGFDPVESPVQPAAAIRHCLEALDVPSRRIPTGLEAAAALYRSELAGRRMLIVLDNALDEIQVRPLLPGTPGCLTVVTSRDALAGLVAAEAAHAVDLGLLSTDEAAQLLSRRLGADRVVNEWQAVTALIESCARLPLALAIVAARAAVRPAAPLAVLAGELHQARLNVLGGDDPHTNLRAVIGHSYDALSAPAQRLFRLLGLHPGPDLAAPAAAALAALPPGGTGALLAELTGANLLTEHRPGRYTHHDLLRAYAAELVAADPDHDIARLRVLDHYLHTAYAADRRLYPARDPVSLAAPEAWVRPGSFADERAALDWFTTEQATLLTAIDHAAAHGLDTHAWQLVWTVRTVLGRRGLWSELAAVTGTALAVAVRLGDPAVQARAHHQLGTTCVRLGRLDEAERELNLGRAQFHELGNRTGEARAHHHLSYLFERRHEPEQSRAHGRQALELYRQAGHRNGEAHALNSIGWYSAQLGDEPEALASCRRALAIFEELADDHGQANTLDSLGYVHHRLGEHAAAVACFRRALALFRKLGNRYNEADTLTRLGDTLQAAGASAAARSAWQDALTILTDLRHPDVGAVRARLDP
ncbi:DNA-binding SARP family transcriptional activator/Tfp pilus assembly protein PilF [Actinoplanes tereljensis]|uniref:SARP family transcriptional regulator n=1 Tax=Paractinoplanes tereljensis TaxID=571912 RepID=A0A919NHJ5_9ACTN|nr:tetratricopeptide repeat protein [Actinoplanes tereljensis]GIF18116.1 SARP family transcriptional regulator [Actinoplanes tereljensis]